MDHYHTFCLEEIKFHTDKIQEIIQEGLLDPKGYYERQLAFMKDMAKALPFLALATHESPRVQHSETEESSRDRLRGD
jgi:hypothetical protein